MKKIYRNTLILFFVISSIYFFYYFGKDINDKVDFLNIKEIISQEKNREALELIEFNLKKHPQNGMLFYYKALVLKNLGEYDQALKELDNSLRIGYPEVLSYNLKSFIYGKYKSDVDKQLYYAEKALEIDPSDSEAYYLKAMAYKEKKNYDMALKNINSAIRNDESDYDFIYERALILSELGKKDEAINDLIAFLKKYPHYADAWYELFLVYSFLGKTTNAFYCIEKALKLIPENILYLMEKAYYEEKNGNYVLALTNMLNVERLAGKNILAENLYFIAKQLYRLAKYNEALKYINKAIEKSDKKNALFYELRGKINLQLNRKKYALKDWSDMVKIDSSYEVDKIKYEKMVKNEISHLF